MKLAHRIGRTVRRAGQMLLMLPMLLLVGCSERAPEPTAATTVAETAAADPEVLDAAEQQAVRAAALLRTRVDSRIYAGPWPQADGGVAEVELEFFVLPGHSEGDLRLRLRAAGAASTLGSWRIASGDGAPIEFEVRLQDEGEPYRLRRAQDGALELETGPESTDLLRLHLVESRDAAEGDAAAAGQLDEVEALDEPDAAGDDAGVEVAAGSA